MKGAIQSLADDYQALLNKARKKLRGKWVKLQSSGERAAIEHEYISTHGVTFTLRTCSNAYIPDQKYGTDFVEW